ncbi:MAG: hypothetical protein HF314_12040 [Ignavibacteria bacterium]|jgi:hypothetical protein|nr:hypothetical protein [Ignavibacteria bacterium]MCU7503801.1 hypothetical protein [Ignavibacteria bacterium]MCU7517185.1 hypothetical protein [Ignavibacteria bacterium]
MKPFEILRTGKFTDSKGRNHEFTEADLEERASKYNSEKHEAPICIGHPKDNKPAWGWIEKLEKVGDRLIAMPKELIAEFEEMVEKGMFKKRSASFYADGTLRHVAFLGAQPPAVKGLADVEFKESEEETVFEFEETSTDTAESLKVQVKVLEDQVKDLESKAAEAESLRGKVQEFAEQSAELTQMKNDAEDRLKELNLKLRTMEFEQFLQGQMAYGMLTPAQMEMCMKICDALDAVELKDNGGALVFEFSDHTMANPRDVLVEFIKTMPKMVELSEVANRNNAEGLDGVEEDITEFAEANVDPDRLELHKKVLACMKKDGLPYAAALKKVTKK